MSLQKRAKYRPFQGGLRENLRQTRQGLLEPLRGTQPWRNSFTNTGRQKLHFAITMSRLVEQYGVGEPVFADEPIAPRQFGKNVNQVRPNGGYDRKTHRLQFASPEQSSLTSLSDHAECGRG